MRGEIGAGVVTATQGCGKYLEQGEYWYTAGYEKKEWIHGHSAPPEPYGSCKNYPGAYNDARRCKECAVKEGLLW